MFGFELPTVNRPRKITVSSLVAVLLFLLSANNDAVAQQLTATPQEIQQMQNDYDQLIVSWRESIKKVSELSIRFNLSPQEESSEYRKKWLRQVTTTDDILTKLRPAALRLFDNLSSPSHDLTDLMMRFATDLFDSGRYTDANRIAERILQTHPDSPQMLFIQGRCNVYMNQFERAKAFHEKHPALLESLPDSEKLFFEEGIYDAIEAYKHELAIQAKEKEADDLPRVELKTSKGTIIVELFENEAPNTVGNFVNLVEKEHFDDKVFHRVINGFMAQAGLLTSKRVAVPLDYTIYDECGEPNARRHFRGVMSMVKTDDPHTGNGQFFITFIPTFELDGQHTVFGRVISGWQALDQITRTYTQTADGKGARMPFVVPDRIISAKMIRKRDHEYKPDKYTE